MSINLILVCDDHHDGTWEVLEKLVEKVDHANLKVLRKELGGPGLARNVGLDATQSDWVVFWDADDLPNINNTIKALSDPENNTADIICGQYQIIDEKQNRCCYQSSVRETEKENLRAIAVQPGIWRFALRMSFIGALRFEPGKMGEDQEFLFKVFLRNPRIVFTPEYFYQYISGNENQLTANTKNLSDLLLVQNRISKLQKSNVSKVYYEMLNIIRTQIDFSLLKNASNKIKWKVLFILVCKYRNPIEAVRLATTLRIILRERIGRNEKP